MNQIIEETHLHPEVELWLKAAPPADRNTHENAVSLDYLEIYQGSQQFKIKENVSHQAFVEYCGKIGNRSANSTLLRAFFIKNILPAKHDVALLMHHHFGVPLSFFRELKSHLSSMPMGNALFTQKDRNGNETIDGYYQLCGNYKTDAGCFVWFSQSLSPNRPTTYIVVQGVDRPKKFIYDCAGASTAMLLRPFVIDAFLLDDSVRRMGDAVLEPRYGFLRDEWRLLDPKSSGEEKVNKIKKLHEIVREFRLLRDGLVDVKETLLSLDAAQDLYLNSSASINLKSAAKSTKESLSLLSSKSNWLIRALTSLEERASRKIDLQYNIENQQDNQTNLKIAKLTTDIAVYTQKDSSSMITMAAVTMFFLPGTFVSALFSMVFFNLDPTTKELTSAPHIWVFLVITIPLTMAVFVVWKLWSIWRSKKIDGQMDLEGGGLLGNDRLTNEGNPKTSIKSSPTPKEAW